MQSEYLVNRYLWASSGGEATIGGLQEEIDQCLRYQLLLKQPGNETKVHTLQATVGKSALSTSEKIPLKIIKEIRPVGYAVEGERVELRIHIQAEEDAFFNFQGDLILKDVHYDASQLYLPGFWYRKNLRSPENTPSERISKSWIVREDRLSTPLSGIFDQDKKVSYSLIRIDKVKDHALAQHQQGEVILSGHSGLGAVGFGEQQQGEQKQAYLSFAYPYREAPHSYFRKLTLGAPVTAFLHLEKGESVTLHYQVMKRKADHYNDYIKQIWTHAVDLFQPQPLEGNKLSDQEIKRVLAKFYTQSFVDVGHLKGFSGIDLQTHACERKKVLEVGFIGRVLLNAFNALEWAEETNDKKLENIARAVLDSYEQYGFAENGFIRELVDQENNIEKDLYTIRRQSEGIYAVLLYLNYEKKRGKKHPLWEQKILRLLDMLLTLQQADGSFPRKFKGDKTLVDAVGGSSPSAVLPLVMAYKNFGDSKYLHAARKVIDYQEKEIISQSDYFSSTLDADCEDKEASLYAAVALYYMALVTQGAEKERYVALAQQAAYFALSWYYTWDVPFAKGQMLGDLGLKSRGWGNVSVENNHIDVYIFEFDEVLTWLTEETGEHRFAQFAEVIRSSMREQLLPYEGHMVGISKEGYYPEVVQHADWDYGHYGKGFYNLYFAPGWTVTSIWELLTDHRAKNFLTSG